jgi:dTDP-4-amino-4,6-dideoxygalactose transaminase
MTTSCTTALEMAAILCEVGEGDEVVLPSYTFVSTANAFHLRGARLVFVDVRPDTLNLDEAKLEAALTPRTKVIVPVHYAGVGCEMDVILRLAAAGGIRVVEDAAQGVNARYRGRYLGTLGDLGAFSFHETKNFICGEGGALLLGDEALVERAEIIREKGTNRSQFFRGEVDKYTWVDIGSSFLPSDILMAFLYAQLENMEPITARRRHIHGRYQAALRPLEERGLLTLPSIPDHCETNHHMFYVLARDGATRDALMGHLKEHGILAVFHYVPLHTSPMGLRMGYEPGTLPVTESVSERLLRLPFFYGLEDPEVDAVVQEIYDFFRVARP